MRVGALQANTQRSCKSTQVEGSIWIDERFKTVNAVVPIILRVHRNIVVLLAIFSVKKL
jgi:hypothetical protein